MSDYNSSLPVRTENPGDVVAIIADATIPSQQLAVDAAGKITTKLDDAAGNGITSQANGSQQALDVGINVAGVQVDPRDIRQLTASDTVTSRIEDSAGNALTSTSSALDVNLKSASITLPVSGTVTANQGTAAAIGSAWPVKPTDGTNSQSFTAAGEAKVDITQPLPAGSNLIGQIELTDGTNVASITAAGEIKADITQPLPAGSNIIGSVGVTNLPATVDTNFGAAGASTLRTASEIGNATGAADFNNGATGAQTLRVAANLAVAGANVSVSNPVPVTISSSIPGTPVQAYLTQASLAAGSTANLQYTVTSGKTLSLNRIWASASGKIKAVVAVETGVASGVFTTKFVGFNSTATPNIDIEVMAATQVAAGVRVQVAITNEDKQAFDVYATVEGSEI